MFTGIVEDMGTVVGWTESGKDGGWILKISPDHPDLFFKDPTALTYLGASICVSGVCLTVVAFDDQSLEFGVAPETVRRTNFGDFVQSESRVNLERASLASGRNSGHYVQGHVDGFGVVTKRVVEKDSVWVTIQTPAELMPGIVPKGFVCVEGTSLTVCEVGADWFTLMMIDHTQQHVVTKPEHAKVNLELDVMSKYASSATGELRQRVVELESLVGKLEARLAKVEQDSVKRVKQ